MAYVTITKDLTEVKDKVAFGLTKRQIICFSLGGITGVGTYFLTRHSLAEPVPDETFRLSQSKGRYCGMV